MPKKQQPKGQSLLPVIQQSLEDQAKEDSKIPGMPTLAQVRAEATRMGLTEEDVHYVYDIWLANGYRTRTGLKIRDFKAALRIWFRGGFFPSQKTGAQKNPARDSRMDATIKRMKQP